jgi:hypothetical protein
VALAATQVAADTTATAEVQATQTSLAAQAGVTGTVQAVQQAEQATAEAAATQTIEAAIQQTAEAVAATRTMEALKSQSTPTEATQPMLSVRLDVLFGENNWFCFPDRENGVGVRRWPVGTLVVFPLDSVDTVSGTFRVGESPIPVGGGATAELEERLPRIQCPSYQQQALNEWSIAQSSDAQLLDRTRIDQIFGTGNWACLDSFAFAVRVFNSGSAIPIVYPITTLDDSTGKHGVGDTVSPSGVATAWLSKSIARDQCP